MKYIKCLLIGCGTIILCIIALMIVFVIIVDYAITSSSTYAPEHVEYRNAEDLHRISGVQFPEVELVDSVTYDSFSLTMTTLKFMLSDSSSKSELMERIRKVAREDSTYWRVVSNQYEYDSRLKQPEDDIYDDGEGDFIEITLREDNDTIVLRYGTNYM